MFGSTLLALSNSATKVFSQETADFILDNIIPVFEVYMVVVFITRTTVLPEAKCIPAWYY